MLNISEQTDELASAGIRPLFVLLLASFSCVRSSILGIRARIRFLRATERQAIGRREEQAAPVKLENGTMCLPHLSSEENWQRWDIHTRRLSGASAEHREGGIRQQSRLAAGRYQSSPTHTHWRGWTWLDRANASFLSNSCRPQSPLNTARESRRHRCPLCCAHRKRRQYRLLPEVLPTTGHVPIPLCFSVRQSVIMRSIRAHDVMTSQTSKNIKKS